MSRLQQEHTGELVRPGQGRKAEPARTGGAHLGREAEGAAHHEAGILGGFVKTAQQGREPGRIQRLAALVQGHGRGFAGERLQKAPPLLRRARGRGQGGVAVAHLHHLHAPPAAEALPIVLRRLAPERRLHLAHAEEP